MKITHYRQASDLWLAHQQQLQAYLSKHLGDPVLAEELTHRVLLKVVDSCCSGVEIRNVRAWLYQISRNVHTDFLSEQHRARPQVQTPLEEATGSGIWTEMATYLLPLIGLLPEKYATPLRLSDLEEMKQAAIAERLGLSLSATKSRIQRARVMLKDKITECSHLEWDSDGRPVDFAIRSDCHCLLEASGKNC